MREHIYTYANPTGTQQTIYNKVVPKCHISIHHPTL